MNEQFPFSRAPTLGAMARAVGRPVVAQPQERREGLAARIVRLSATPGIVLALLLLAAAFFWRVVALRQVLLPADILYAHDPLWQPLAPHAFTMPANGLDSDALTEFYPWTALAAGALHRGVLPLWNPYSFAGTPFLAAMQTAVFYPVNLVLEWLLPPADVLGARAIVHLSVTLVGAFLFARRLALSRPAAALAALSFGLGLPYVVWLEHPMSGAVAWLPWLLLCSDRLVVTRGSLRWCLAAAAALALELLAGHGESSAHALLLCAAYALFRVARAWRPGLRTRAALRVLAALGLALALGVALSAAHLLPALAQVPASEAAADRTAAAAAAPTGLLGAPAAWTTLVLAVVPDFFGNPTWHIPVLPAASSYNEVALYIGTVPLLLAVLALVYGRVTVPSRTEVSPLSHAQEASSLSHAQGGVGSRVREGVPDARAAHILFFAAAALVALGMAIRLPLLGLLDDLPVLRVTADGRLRFEYAFAVAMLAGYGLDSLVMAGRSRGTWLLTRLWWGLVGLLTVLGVALLLWAHTGTGAPAIPPGTALRAAVPLLWLTLFVGVLWLHRRGLIGAGVLRLLVLALAATDLFALGVGYHTTVPYAQAVATPPAVRAVQRDHSLYRVAGLDHALLPALSSLYGLQDVRGYDPAYDAAYERFFSAIFAASPGMRLGLAPFGPSPAAARVLDLMNVKYIFAACNIPLNERVYHLIYRGAGCVYRNGTVLPRAFVVHTVRWAGPARAIALLKHDAVNLRSTVLLDPRSVSPPPPSQHGLTVVGAPGTGGARQDRVRVTRYDLNSVDVAVQSATRGFLVLGDAAAPGWQAQVDGRPVPIARADAVFRAVAIGPGSHHVSFTYAPATFALGAAISLGALALLLVVTLWRGLAGRQMGPVEG